MVTPVTLPEHVRSLVERVLSSPAAESSPASRQAVYDYTAALTRREPYAGAVPPVAEPYLRKVALNAYKVLDREVEAMGAAGMSTGEIFEVTVVAAVSAGATRMEIALAALEEVR